MQAHRKHAAEKGNWVNLAEVEKRPGAKTSTIYSYSAVLPLIKGASKSKTRKLYYLYS
jgi:hypothetical protein